MTPSGRSGGDPRVAAALEFAALANRGVVAAWMLWRGWSAHVGCDRCAGNGPSAVCWGLEGCHGFASSCGCGCCSEREERELAAVSTHAAFEEIAASLERPEPLSSELAALSRQLAWTRP